MIRNLLLLLYISSTIQVFSQDYIATDSTKATGVNLREGTTKDNCHYIKVKSKSNEITYRPTDLEEYGFKDGSVYVSKTITKNGETRKVFLKRLVSGNTTLYYYASDDFKAYYLEGEDDQLIELSKRGDHEFRQQLSGQMNSCPSVVDKIKLTSYQRLPLTTLVTHFNQCSSRPFPYTKFGIILGYGNTILSAGRKYSGKVNENWKEEQMGFIGGVSMDKPLGGGYFSLHAELLLSKRGFASSEKLNDQLKDVVINITSVDLPLQLRYTVPSLGFRPFINAGAIASYNVKNDGTQYNALIGVDDITITEVLNENLVADFLGGYSIGAGLQRNVSAKKTISLELRYNKLYGGQESLSKGQLVILTGFTF